MDENLDENVSEQVIRKWIRRMSRMRPKEKMLIQIIRDRSGNLKVVRLKPNILNMLIRMHWTKFLHEIHHRIDKKSRLKVNNYVQIVPQVCIHYFTKDMVEVLPMSHSAITSQAS